MTTSVLSSLKVTARPEIKKQPPILNKRMKLIDRLEQQKELAMCMLENKPFVAYKEKMVKDPETGERTKQRRQVTVRPWYYDTEGHYFLEVKIGIKPIELQKGKPAIDVGDKAKLPDTIDTLISAVEKGEFDTFLLPLTKPETQTKTTANTKTAKR
jgi:hypothetical protein